MIIQKTEETGISLGFDTTVKSKVKEADMGFMFRTLSSSLYKDKLGSLVRETVCNCFDAYVGTGKTPVAVIRYNPAEHSLSFIDKGKGMSRKFIETTYVDFFDSTKREESGSFGAFGLGGKVGLAINNAFYIESICEGAKSLYLFSYNKDNLMELPTLDLLNEESTTEENGTTIKVHLPDKYSYGVGAIREAIIQQLKYFDSVVLEGFTDFDFEQELVKGKNFIINPKHTRQLEICFGKVRYPLDYNLVGVPSLYHTLPIALYFDLDTPFLPTPAREELQYTAETKQIILEKLRAAVAELQALFEEKNQTIISIIDFAKIGFNSWKNLQLTPKVKIQANWFPEYKLELPFKHNFKTFQQDKFNLILQGAHNVWTTRKNYIPENIMWSKDFKAVKANFVKATKVYYGFGTRELNYEYLIPMFYEKTIVEVVFDKYIDQLDDQGKVNKVPTYKIINHKKIDYKKEINDFYQLWNKEIEGTYKLLDPVVVPRTSNPNNAKVTEIKEHNGSSRTTIITKIDTLLKFKYLVYLDNNSLYSWSNYNKWKNQFHRIYELFTPGKSVNEVVRFISCNETEKKKLMKLPNVITLEQFKETDLYKSFIKRSITRASASYFLNTHVKGIVQHRKPKTLEFREWYSKLTNLAGNIPSNPFLTDSDIKQDPDNLRMLTKYSNYNALRTLKDYYKRKFETIKAEKDGKN